MTMDRRTRRWFDLGRFAAFVALWALLLGGAMPVPAMAGMDPSQAAICHAGGPAKPAPPARHHETTCPSCCLFHGLHAYAAILTARPGLAAPCGAMLGLASPLPPARAPPAQAEDAAYPRGPPTLA
jgi:hypothetical protein